MQSVVSISQSDKAIVAEVKTRDLSHDVSLQFQKRLEGAIAEAPNLPLILDMSTVEFLPSLALGILVATNKKLRESGHKLVLVGVHPQIAEVMTITGLVKMLEVYANRDEALRHL